MRHTALASALALTLAGGLAVPAAPAQDGLRLPDIGSSAGELLTPARQAEYGSLMLRELRNYGYVLDDPLIDEWLNTMGRRLGANSDNPRQSFTFFMMKDRQINAFATLGGYVAVNAGLVLTAEDEDEVAAVLSHEIAHVTQQHVLRAVEKAQRDQIPILLGMLAAVVAAQQAGGNSSGDASMAAIAGGMGLMQQLQIDYTRANESEADRLGIRTLARSGYDVDAMAEFFERMSLAMRGNRGGYSAPDFLQTHPVTTTRISEARARAEQLKKGTRLARTSTPGGERVERIDVDRANLDPAGTATALPDNPLLPANLRLAGDVLSASGPTGQFDWARERLRALSAATPDVAIREYEGLRRSQPKGLSDAQQYGLALAWMQNRSGDPATALASLAQRHPDNLYVNLAWAEAESRGGHPAEANRRFDELARRWPGSVPVAITYARILNEQGGQTAGLRAQAVLRPLLSRAAADPIFQQAYARACELAGDGVRAGEAYAEAAYLNGRAEQALMQLQTLKRRDDLDYVARARIDARIAAITPTVLELQRQGIRDPDIRSR